MRLLTVLGIAAHPIDSVARHTAQLGREAIGLCPNPHLSYLSVVTAIPYALSFCCMSHRPLALSDILQLSETPRSQV